MNLTQIGLNLGGRDHSTVINMFNRFEAEKGQKRWIKILNDLEIE
jgi:chromosomal replication initiation ATPase DnaA